MSVQQTWKVCNTRVAVLVTIDGAVSVAPPWLKLACSTMPPGAEANSRLLTPEVPPNCAKLPPCATLREDCVLTSWELPSAREAMTRKRSELPTISCGSGLLADTGCVGSGGGNSGCMAMLCTGATDMLTMLLASVMVVRSQLEKLAIGTTGPPKLPAVSVATPVELRETVATPLLGV